MFFVNLPSVHDCAKLRPRASLEGNCTSSLACQHMSPDFIFVSTEAAFFMLASVTFVAGIGAPEAVKCFGV
jgi:hypothetical protein